MKKIIPYMILTSAITHFAHASETLIPDLVFTQAMGKSGYIYDYNNETKSLVLTNLKAPSKDALYIRPMHFETVQGGERGQIECFKNQKLVIDGKVQLIDKNDPANYLDYLKRNTKFDVEMKINSSGEVKYNKKLKITDEEGRVHEIDYSKLQMVRADKQIRINCDKVHFNKNSILLSNANLKVFVADEISGNITIKSSRAIKDLSKNELIKAALAGENGKNIDSCGSSTHGANGPDGKNGNDADILSSASSGTGGGHGAHGGDGCDGLDGGPGLDGINASAITVQVTNFDMADSLIVESIGSKGGEGGRASNGTIGGDGGHGGRGGNGGDGNSGGLHHGKGAGKGGDGGNGGKGGQGGNGGRGGYGGQSGEINIQVYLPENEINISSDEFFNTSRFKNINNVLNSMLLLSAGGNGGAGGIFGAGANGGKAGNGGQGGDGGSGGILVGGGSSGRTGLGGYAGENGSDGKNGEWGQPGYAGRASYQGHKLISVSADQLERVRPQVDFNINLK